MSSTRARRRMLFVPAVAALLSLLAACAPAAPERVDKPPVTAGVAEELLPYYGQEPDWASCGENLECATVTAPLDWHDIDAGEIELALVRHLALEGNSHGSLLINPGGPGGSGVDIVTQAVGAIVDEDVQRSFDIVGFDPRGVGQSTAVTCYDTEAMDAFLYEIPDGERGGDEWVAELEARNASFAEACQANSGGILEFITTEQSARDLDMLRAVLGEEKLRYLGFSYGTFLGATYAKLFPERVGRLVLDGAIDPSISGGQVGTAQALGFEQALRAFMDACLSLGQECPFTGTVDDAMADLGALLAEVDRYPVPAPDGRMVGADTTLTGIISALYAQEAWPYLREGLSLLMADDPSTILWLADTYNGRGENGYLDDSTEAFHAYNCMDYPDESEEATAAQQARIQEKAPTIAPYWSGPDLCDAWPFEPTGVREPIEAAGAAPILVIGTTGDPATPYEWAVSLADQLASGVLLTYEGEGHTAYAGPSECIDETVNEYLLEGTVPEDGLVCS